MSSNGQIDMKRFIFGSTNWKALVPVTMGLVVIVLVLLVFLSSMLHVNHGDGQLRSQTHLRSIAQGLCVYAGNNSDLYPAQEGWQDVLITNGICEDWLFTSPADDGDSVTYILVADQMTFASDEILLYEDPKHHKEGVLVAFGDIQVEYVDFDKFEQMLAEQIEAQIIEP